MRKTRIYIDKPILVGQAILDKCKELMHKFFCDYLKPGEKLRLLYMDTDSFVLYVETDDFYKDTKDDLKEWFDTSSYDKNMVLPEEFAKNGYVNKKVIGMMKDEIRKGHITEFVALALKVYAYQQINIDNTLSEEEKARGTKKVVTKKSLSFDKYKCLSDNETVECIQYRIQSTPIFVDTLEMTKITLKNYDNKRLNGISFNGITTYPYGTNAFKVCFEELKIKQAFSTYVDSYKKQLLNA